MNLNVLDFSTFKDEGNTAHVNNDNCDTIAQNSQEVNTVRSNQCCPTDTNNNQHITTPDAT